MSAHAETLPRCPSPPLAPGNSRSPSPDQSLNLSELEDWIIDVIESSSSPQSSMLGAIRRLQDADVRADNMDPLMISLRELVTESAFDAMCTRWRRLEPLFVSHSTETVALTIYRSLWAHYAAVDDAERFAPGKDDWKLHYPESLCRLLAISKVPREAHLFSPSSFLDPLPEVTRLDNLSLLDDNFVLLYHATRYTNLGHFSRAGIAPGDEHCSHTIFHTSTDLDSSIAHVLVNHQRLPSARAPLDPVATLVFRIDKQGIVQRFKVIHYGPKEGEDLQRFKFPSNLHAIGRLEEPLADVIIVSAGAPNDFCLDPLLTGWPESDSPPEHVIFISPRANEWLQNQLVKIFITDEP